MLKPARMKKVDILTLGRQVNEITEELGKLGLLHLLDVERYGRELGVRPFDRRETAEKLSELRRLTEELLALLRVEKPPEAKPLDAPLDEVEKGLHAVEREVKSVTDRIRSATLEIKNLTEVRKEVEAFQVIEADIKRINDFSFLHFAVGSLDERGLREFRRAHPDERAVVMPVITSDGEEKIVAVTTKKGRWALEGELEKVGFKKDEISDKLQGIPREILSEAERRIRRLESEVVALERQRATLREKHATFLAACGKRIAVEQKIIEAEMRFGRTENTFLISGWVPEKDVARLTKRMSQLTGGRLLIDTQSPESLDEVKEGKLSVPVLLDNPRFLKPFERLISTYGFPSYNEIEPTLFVAISFLLMFGLMFGDVGQGAVIALIGLVLNRVYSKRRAAADAGAVMCAAGISAAIFGVLYGSVFSSENIIPALWLNPMKDTMFFLKLGILLGVAMISLGIVLNIVNCFRKGDYLRGILHRFGVVGGIFYAGAVGLGIKFAVTGEGGVGVGYLLLFIVLPLLILFFREPIYNIIAGKSLKPDSGIGEYLMESFVEMMETATTFLANTVSFVRVSAFALSHVGLSIAVFTIADSVRHLTGGAALSLLVIVLGNAVIIILEGLIVAIQTMRLEYYEFFSKFFEGGGEKFDPFVISE